MLEIGNTIPDTALERKLTKLKPANLSSKQQEKYNYEN